MSRSPLCDVGGSPRRATNRRNRFHPVGLHNHVAQCAESDQDPLPPAGAQGHKRSWRGAFESIVLRNYANHSRSFPIRHFFCRFFLFVARSSWGQDLACRTLPSPNRLSPQTACGAAGAPRPCPTSQSLPPPESEGTASRSTTPARATRSRPSTDLDGRRPL